MKHEHLNDTIPAYFGSLVSQTVAKPIQWLWQDRIPQGRLTLLEGESGIGKSLLALHIAASVSTAQPLPGTTVPATGSVILVTPSPHEHDTIKPRLHAAGADLSRIFLLHLPPRFTPTDTIAQDLDDLEAAIKDLGASLVIIDPLASFLNRPNRSARNSRSLNFTFLAQLAKRTSCAFLFIRTISKPQPHSLTSTGPLDLLDTLSSRLLIMPDPQQPEHHLLICTKHTLCAQPPILAYRLTPQDPSVPTIDWLGESTPSNVLDLSQPSTQRQRILTLLHESPTALSPNDLTQLAEQTHDSTCKLLQRMLRSGLLVSPARGLYTLPNHPCLPNYPAYGRDSSLPVPPATPDDQTAHPPVHSVHTPIPDCLPTLLHSPVQMPIADSLSDLSHTPVHSVHTPIPDCIPFPFPLHTPIPIYTIDISLDEIEPTIPIQERVT